MTDKRSKVLRDLTRVSGILEGLSYTVDGIGDALVDTCALVDLVIRDIEDADEL